MKTIKIFLIIAVVGVFIASCEKKPVQEEAGFPEVDFSMIQWGPDWIPFDTNMLHVDTPKTTFCFRGKGLLTKKPK